MFTEIEMMSQDAAPNLAIEAPKESTNAGLVGIVVFIDGRSETAGTTVIKAGPPSGPRESGRNPVRAVSDTEGPLATTPADNRPDSVRDDAGKRTPGWIGVDLDGTLAKSVKSQAGEDIGVPVYRMVKQVKKWLAQGHDVRIFTARVNPHPRRIEATRARRAIESWSERHLGQVLPITYEKDWDMALLFDDRARQVEHDTGRILGGYLRRGLKTHRNAILPAIDG